MKRTEAVSMLQGLKQTDKPPVSEVQAITMAISALRAQWKSARLAVLGGRARAAKYTRRQLSRVGRESGGPAKRSKGT
jgi:hypothetical protein